MYRWWCSLSGCRRRRCSFRFSVALVPGVRRIWMGACCGGLAYGLPLADCRSGEVAAPELGGCSVLIDSRPLVWEQWRRGML